MGIIQVGMGAAASVLQDQWREYFYCPALEADVLVKKGQKRAKKVCSEATKEVTISFPTVRSLRSMKGSV